MVFVRAFVCRYLYILSMWYTLLVCESRPFNELIPMLLPLLRDGRVYIILDTGLQVLEAATGAPLWSATTPGCSETSPVVAGGVVYTAGKGTGNNAGGVHAFDGATGVRRWSSLAGTSSPWATPVVQEGIVYTSGFTGGQYNTGVVYALDAASGNVRWHVNLTVGEAYDYAPLAPAVAGGRVFVAGAMPTLYALDAASGVQVWNASGICAGHLWMVPAVANGTVYAGCDHGMFYALDAATGARQWDYDVGGGEAAARSPAVADGRVYFGVNQQHDDPGKDKLLVLAAWAEVAAGKWLRLPARAGGGGQYWRGPRARKGHMRAGRSGLCAVCNGCCIGIKIRRHRRNKIKKNTGCLEPSARNQETS